MLKRFQQAGHRPIALIGGATDDWRSPFQSHRTKSECDRND
ncbi:hypothetical protein [Amphritea pacifica]|uniref:Uncharacterized protein n=1 Tax=Amphritea pacifica TaxID=2811233 RepID=A0ABS2WAD7_9GAMM|nr:hypothetical protein [Amphritea pacifica]MBN1006759.1 hypothetical protein [Amphritea pacifica]